MCVIPWPAREQSPNPDSRSERQPDCSMTWRRKVSARTGQATNRDPPPPMHGPVLGRRSVTQSWRWWAAAVYSVIRGHRCVVGRPRVSGLHQTYQWRPGRLL